MSIPRDTFVGLRQGPLVESEVDHVYRCQVCGQLVDMRDLGEVFDHEGDAPHPVEDRVEQGRREGLLALAGRAENGGRYRD